MTFASKVKSTINRKQNDPTTLQATKYGGGFGFVLCTRHKPTLPPVVVRRSSSVTFLIRAVGYVFYFRESGAGFPSQSSESVSRRFH